MSERQSHADTIVNQYATYSAGAGFIPMPLIDMAAITGLQLKMIRDMSKVYEIPFRKERAKSIVSALVGGVGSTALAYGAGGAVLRSVPFLGPVLGILSMPAFGYAATYAVGRVFVQHFESGGTFLDFDPAKVRAYFNEQYERARGRSAAPGTAAAASA